MSNKDNYVQLSEANKVKVNAAIIEALKSDNNGFTKTFMAEAAKRPEAKPEEKFQQVLNDLRDEMARVVDQLPNTSSNGLSNTINLSQQMGLLRAIRDFNSTSADRVVDGLKKLEKFHYDSDAHGGAKNYEHLKPLNIEKARSVADGCLKKLTDTKQIGRQLVDSGISLSEGAAVAAAPAQTGGRSLG